MHLDFTNLYMLRPSNLLRTRIQLQTLSTDITSPGNPVPTLPYSYRSTCCHTVHIPSSHTSIHACLNVTTACSYTMGASNSFLKRQKIVFSLTALVVAWIDQDQFNNSNNLRNKALFHIDQVFEMYAYLRVQVYRLVKYIAIQYTVIIFVWHICSTTCFTTRIKRFRRYL